MKKLLLILPALAFPSIVSATPSVTSVTPASAQVGRYQKYEATIIINKAFPAGSFLPYYYYDPADTPASDPGRTSPYGVDGISIDAHITSPSGKLITLPAFYYEDYIRGGSLTSKETMTATGNYSWKIRFAPAETGTYTYYLTVQDKDGSTRYPTSGSQSFTSVASNSKGFVRISPRDRRFMEFDSGQSFIPLSSAHQYYVCCKSYGDPRSWDYELAFNNFGANGINFLRIWDQNDSYALTTEGHFDGYGPNDGKPTDAEALALPKGTQMNQRGNYEEDKIIESAERNGVYIELSSHGDAFWIWDGSIYNEGWNTSIQPADSPRRIGYWKRNFRYRVARWGYSTSVLSWELWNEHGHVPVGSNMYNFYQIYGNYQKQTDPYGHLRTTSQGSQAFSPAFWSSGAFDVANYHNYMMSWMPNNTDEAAFIYTSAWCLRNTPSYCNGLGLGDGSAWSGSPLPWIWGETDVGTSVWDEVNPLVRSGEGRIRMLHNTTWAGLFSPLGTSPVDWYFVTEDNATTLARYADRKAASAFFNGLDYAGGQFTFLMSPNAIPTGYTGETIANSNTQARVYAMRRGDKKAAYLWVQDKSYTWANASTTPSAFSTTVTVGGLLNESYKVEVWNTHTGQIISSQTQSASGGSLAIPLSISKDVAVKIESSVGSQSILGDANNDGQVNGQDYVIWLIHYAAPAPVGPSDGDFNTDGQVNGQDYVIWLTHYS